MSNHFLNIRHSMVRRSTKQIVTQTVNVHIGGNKRKNGRRRKRGGGGGGGGSSMPAQVHGYNPVYIQSGAPSEVDNPLHRAIRDLNDKVDRHHVERSQNPLLRMVGNVDRGHIADEAVPRPSRQHSSVFMEESPVTAYPIPAAKYEEPLTPAISKGWSSEYEGTRAQREAENEAKPRRVDRCHACGKEGHRSNSKLCKEHPSNALNMKVWK